MRFLDEHGVISVGAGEMLQVGPKLDSRWLTKNWHTAHAFQMPYWQQLQQGGRVIFLRLTSNHRLPAEQFKMLKRVCISLAAAMCCCQMSGTSYDVDCDPTLQNALHSVLSYSEFTR